MRHSLGSDKGGESFLKKVTLCSEESVGGRQWVVRYG